MHDLATIQRMNREATEQAERDAAMKRHPAGKARATTTSPALKPAEVAHLASASAHELAREMLAGFTRNGEIPFALSGQAALDIIAVAIEADRAQRKENEGKALKLLEEVSKLGLTFDIGSAYISRAYIDKQTELLAQVKELQED